ncbi:MAG: hypothetical protein K2X03_16805 [Bryobacteraceae bacterium]|nr:hypothetical protein [Bryobacteraceae bacterium]
MRLEMDLGLAASNSGVFPHESDGLGEVLVIEMNPLAAIAALGDGVELVRTKVTRFAHPKVEARGGPKSAYVVTMVCGSLEVVKRFKVKNIPFQNEPSFRSDSPDPVPGTFHRFSIA